MGGIIINCIGVGSNRFNIITIDYKRNGFILRDTRILYMLVYIINAKIAKSKNAIM